MLERFRRKTEPSEQPTVQKEISAETMMDFLSTQDFVTVAGITTRDTIEERGQDESNMLKERKGGALRQSTTIYLSPVNETYDLESLRRFNDELLYQLRSTFSENPTQAKYASENGSAVHFGKIEYSTNLGNIEVTNETTRFEWAYTKNRTDLQKIADRAGLSQSKEKALYHVGKETILRIYPEQSLAQMMYERSQGHYDPENASIYKYDGFVLTKEWDGLSTDFYDKKYSSDPSAITPFPTPSSLSEVFSAK